jgi:hypothetical protein
MTTYKAIIRSSFRKKEEIGGVLECVIPGEDNDWCPADTGLIDAIVPVIYTSPYAFHGDGGMIAIPPPGSKILIQSIGKSFYYLTSIVGPEPSDLDEMFSGDVDERVTNGFSCERSYEKIFSEYNYFPDTFMIRHPKGHVFQMKDDVPLEDGEVKPSHKVHNSKIEMKSSGNKIVSLDDSVNVDAVRMGVDKQGRKNDEFDGIIIGQSKGITGPRCIKAQAQNNITIKTDSGDIVNQIVDGNKFEVENTSTGLDGSLLSTKPKINLGATFGDINLVAGTNHLLSDPIKAKVGPAKIIIEALGMNRQASWVEQILPPGAPPGTPPIVQQMNAPVAAPIIRITSEGSIDIISTEGINMTSAGDINIQSTGGNVNIGGANIPSSGSWLPSVPTIPIPLPTSMYPPIPSFRGYVPFGWMMPFPLPPGSGLGGVGVPV